MAIHTTVTLTPRGALFADFAAWVVAGSVAGRASGAPARIVDIGAGASQFAYPAPIVAAGALCDGVDPAATIHANPYLHARYQMPIEQFAAEHPAAYDAAVCVFVLEHVRDPAPFLAACARVLRPGGSLYALTPNRDHYFGLTAWAAARLGLEDALLNRALGKAAKETYHVPVQYRLNTVRALHHGLERAGFARAEIRCFDQPDRFTDYFPRGLKWFPGAYARAAYRLRAAPGCGYLLGYLAVRAAVTEPGGAAEVAGVAAVRDPD